MLKKSSQKVDKKLNEDMQIKKNKIKRNRCKILDAEKEIKKFKKDSIQ